MEGHHLEQSDRAGTGEGARVPAGFDLHDGRGQIGVEVEFRGPGQDARPPILDFGCEDGGENRLRVAGIENEGWRRWRKRARRGADRHEGAVGEQCQQSTDEQDRQRRKQQPRRTTASLWRSGCPKFGVGVGARTGHGSLAVGARDPTGVEAEKRDTGPRPARGGGSYGSRCRLLFESNPSE